MLRAWHEGLIRGLISMRSGQLGVLEHVPDWVHQRILSVFAFTLQGQERALALPSAARLPSNESPGETALA